MTPLQQPPHIPGGFVPLQHQSSLHANASGLAGRPSSAVSPPLAMHRPASAPPIPPAASCLSPAPFELLGGASHAAGSGFGGVSRGATATPWAPGRWPSPPPPRCCPRPPSRRGGRRCAACRRSRPASPSPPRAPSRAATARAARRSAARRARRRAARRCRCGRRRPGARLNIRRTTSLFLDDGYSPGATPSGRASSRCRSPTRRCSSSRRASRPTSRSEARRKEEGMAAAAALEGRLAQALVCGSRLRRAERGGGGGRRR